MIAAGLSYGCECTSVWVSGGTVYYAIANGSNYFDYNSGTLNVGGTIAWSGQTKVTTEYNTQGSISIITDALRDPWVAAYTESGSAGASPKYTEVYEDSGGVWSAAANSPILGGDMGPQYQDGWVQVVPTPNPSSGVPGVGVLYSFIDCTGCYTGQACNTPRVLHGTRDLVVCDRRWVGLRRILCHGGGEHDLHRRLARYRRD